MSFRVCAILLALPLTLAAQQPPPAAVTFHFEHAGLPVPDYTLTVHEDGSGSYTATYAASPADTSSKYGYSYVAAQAGAASATSTRSITLSAVTTARIFERVRGTDHFRGGCESRQKNIANTGAKTITYTGPDGSANCTFNYSENKAVVALTDMFQEIAETLDEGRSIDLKHRYDRLGLDRELANLAEAVSAGRAIEVATIAPVLQSLCDDSQVMERVRKRAAGLLLASGAAH
jgi:hypothetical protein